MTDKEKILSEMVEFVRKTGGEESFDDEEYIRRFCIGTNWKIKDTKKIMERIIST